VARTIDVKEKLQAIIDGGGRNFSVSAMAQPVDPAYMVVKTLTIAYEMDGETHTWQGTDPMKVNLSIKLEKSPLIAEPSINVVGTTCLNAWSSGHYDVTLVSGKKWSADVVLPEPFEISGPWQVQFPQKTVTLDKLISWSESDDESIQYFSGTAVYSKMIKMPETFLVADQRIYLDLGQVDAIAELTVNSKSFDVLWKPDKTVDITDALKSSENHLEIRVTNLWPNRLIGDAKLPVENERQTNGTLNKWPEWIYGGQPDPSGRETFCMWNLWSKDDALVSSGLIGPVKLLPVKQCVVF
jgi:hypothetical protein